MIENCIGDPMLNCAPVVQPWYHTLAVLFIFFMFYSFFGWLMEIIYILLRQHKVSSRGFLNGPICPIYGVGAIIVLLLLQNVDNVIAIFCVSMVGCGLLEYTASYIMEKLFHVRWWDYSYMKFHLNGRICLLTMVMFGILGVLAVKFANPFLLSTIDSWSNSAVYALALILLILLAADIIFSLILIIRFRVTAGTIELDATEEISQNIKEVLKTKGRGHKRLVKAFPNLEVKPVKPKVKKRHGTKSTEQN